MLFQSINYIWIINYCECSFIIIYDTSDVQEYLHKSTIQRSAFF